MAPRLLESRLPRERHRFGRNGRLQPDVGGLSLCPPRPLRARPGAEDPRGRGKRDLTTCSGCSRTPSRTRWPTPWQESSATRRRSGSPPSPARSGSAPLSGARWTPPSAASTTSSAAAGGNRSASRSRCSRVVVVFIGASIFGPAIESALVASTDRLPFGLSDIKAIDTVIVLAIAFLVTFLICSVIFWAVPKEPHALARRLARGALRHRRRRPRQLALPDLPLERLQPLPLRLDPRLHPHRPALVLRAQPGADGGRGDQLAALRAPRHRRTALRAGARSLPGPPEAVPAAARAQEPVPAQPPVGQ